MAKPNLRTQFSNSRGSSSSSGTNSPTKSSSSLHNIIHYQTSSSTFQAPREEQPRKESDAECWERMLALQMEYHCYNSARLEAAVQALESGCPIEEVPIPSRLCLDLLNEGLRTRIETQQRLELRQ